MAEACHQFAHGRALLRGECPGGVAQVVEVQALLAGGFHRLGPLGVERRSAQAVGQGAGEDRVVGAETAVQGQVKRERVRHGLGERDGAPAGGGLGRCGEALAFLELDDLHLDAHERAFEVDVASAQTEQLTEAEASEAGEQYQRAVAFVDRPRDLKDDVGVDERALRAVFLAGAADLARVGDEAFVLDGGVEHRSQQAVGLGGLVVAGGFGDPVVPGAYVAHPELSDGAVADWREDVSVEEVLVQLHRAGSEAAPVVAALGAQPLLGVIGDRDLPALGVERDAGELLAFDLALEVGRVGGAEEHALVLLVARAPAHVVSGFAFSGLASDDVSHLGLAFF